MKVFNYETFKKVLKTMEEFIDTKQMTYKEWIYAYEIYEKGKENVSWDVSSLDKMSNLLLNAKVVCYSPLEKDNYNKKSKLLEINDNMNELELSKENNEEATNQDVIIEDNDLNKTKILKILDELDKIQTEFNDKIEIQKQAIQELLK